MTSTELPSKYASLIELIALMASPFLVWFALYIAALRLSLDLRRILPWIRTFQWIAWAAAAVLFIAVAAAGNDRFTPFACVLTSVSPALSIAERNLKKRFAPELMTSEESPDGWWPKKN